MATDCNSYISAVVFEPYNVDTYENVEDKKNPIY